MTAFHLDQSGSGEDVQRLISWKAIASFFDRDERTVRRWEQERGLPVHRVPGGRGGVFAYASELREWLHSNREVHGVSDGHASIGGTATEALRQSEEAVASNSQTVDAITVGNARASSRKIVGWLLAGALVGAAAISFVTTFHFPRHNVQAAGPATVHVPEPEARAFYLKGRRSWERRTDGSLKEAVDAYMQAIVHDSDYAEAYAGLAASYDLMPEYSSMPASEALPRAIAAAEKALSLDDSLPEGHRALAFAVFWWQWDFPRARKEFERAIALNPQEEESHHWYATSLALLGDFPAAKAQIALARQLAPSSRSILADQAFIGILAGGTADGIVQLQGLERAEPDFYSPPHYLERTYFRLGNFQAFLREAKRAAAISQDQNQMTVAAAAERGWAQNGERGMLEGMYTAQKKIFDDGQSSGGDLAHTCAFLGRKQEAMKYLYAALAGHDYTVRDVLLPGWAPAINGDPSFEDFRSKMRQRFR